MAWLLAKVIVLLTALCMCNGLYEDQINKYDWKKEYVGKIKGVVYDASISASKNLYVTTEKNVVASLGSKNGELNWRQISEDHVEKIVQYEGGILTVSANGILRLWDSANGLMKWDINLLSEVKGVPTSFEFVDVGILELAYTDGNVIAVLSSNGLFTVRFLSSSAKVKSKVKFVEVASSKSSETKLLIDSESSQILVVNMALGSSISATFFDAKTLEIMLSVDLQTAWLDSIDNVIIAENLQLVYASKAMDALYIIDLRKGKEISSEPLSALEISSIALLSASKDKDVKNLGEDFYVTLDNGDVIHMRLNDESGISVIGRISGPENSKFVQLDALKVGSEKYFFITRVENGNLKIDGFQETSGKEDVTLALSYPLPSDVGDIDGIFINMHLKRTSPVGYRVLITTVDGCTLMMTLPTRLAWRRDEALASIVAAEMLDLPLSDIEAGIEVEFEKAEKMSVAAMFANRIRAQMGQANTFAKQITKGIKEGTLFEKKTKDPLIQDESLTRDPFSLHKMLVLVTKSGKLFGIDSLSGDVIWRLFAPNAVGMKLKLFIQRTTAHFPNPPLALLLGSNTAGGSSTTTVLTFNPITGEEVKTAESGNFDDVIQVMLLPFSDSDYLRPLLLLRKSLDIILIPDTPEIREKVESLRKSIFLFNLEETGKITGYSMQPGLNMMETFIIRIPTDQQVLLVQGKDAFEKIDSLGRPLADRSVIYKYLNPNLVLIISGSKDASELSSSIAMYLIDAVSGHIIHYATHKKASGPVHAVHSENWVIYTYWSTKARRTEIASYELYEGKQLRNDTVFSSFDNLPGVPMVFSQGYILGATVAAMGVSRTEKALTSRQILFGLSRGSVMGLPRKVFDPRRPLNPEQSDREEGLIPYSPEIQVHPSLLISYNKTIHGIANIYSCPSALESTSIVLVTGLDVFFTRTQPSKMFDVLKEDFEYMLIIAVLSGMFIAALATRKLAQNKKLKKAWR